MNVVQILKQYPQNKLKVERLHIKLEALEEDRQGRSMGYGEIKSNRDRISDITGETASGIVDKSKEIQKDIDKVQNDIDIVRWSLRQLTKAERVVVLTRYIYCQEYRRIALDLDIGVTEVKEIRTSAVKQLDKLFKRYL